jgi:hypothetical protein
LYVTTTKRTLTLGEPLTIRVINLGPEIVTTCISVRPRSVIRPWLEVFFLGDDKNRPLDSLNLTDWAWESSPTNINDCVMESGFVFERTVIGSQFDQPGYYVARHRPTHDAFSKYPGLEEQQWSPIFEFKPAQ